MQAWNIGVQREIMKNTVIEVRYLGNRGSNVWHTFNLNEVNIFENGFLQEFKNAQQNLAINVANGRTGFANQGLQARWRCRSSTPPSAPAARRRRCPAGQAYTNGGFITNLQQGEAGRMAASLSSAANYTCRMVGSSFSPCASPRIQRRPVRTR